MSELIQVVAFSRLSDEEDDRDTLDLPAGDIEEEGDDSDGILPFADDEDEAEGEGEEEGEDEEEEDFREE